MLKKLGLSNLTGCDNNHVFYFYSNTLGPSALKAAASVKRKESAHSGDSRDKKKKSALDEIIEACFLL